ncbi:SP-RING-type domain-containing protein [Mycena indigotica]|uniref:SP-RING-type domain-containing protein n=1 Tax=Mycena indigotica TaxID=2126181 RepID=A0A8H6S6D0_9AGAR|nr:SP-RING-type domain-containing protein [Mycena indigotica]KAF7293608.1 SP-RING-type domain-containing protein [Mycena indigotica]
MPVATTARRKRQHGRQPSSDIEEDNGTQRTKGREDVDSDEEEPLIAKQEKTKGKKKAKQEAQVQPMEEDDEDDVIDIANFPAQPLTRADCTKLNGLSEDWKNASSVVQRVAEMMGSTASAMVDSQSDALDESLAQLDHLMRDFIDVEALVGFHSHALTDIAQAIFRGEAITDVKNQYLEAVDAANAKYDTETSRQKYANHEEYTSFRQSVWNAQNTEDAMPPMTDFIPREDGDESDDDDEIIIGGVSQDYKCPLLMTTLSDPYTSTVCKHSYSGSAIKEYFSKKQKEKCPAAGCSKQLTLAQCKPNPQLAKLIKDRERRRQANQRDDSDDGEAIE